jgi:hypothetical protein
MALRLTLSRVDAEPSPLRGQCLRPGEGSGLPEFRILIPQGRPRAARRKRKCGIGGPCGLQRQTSLVVRIRAPGGAGVKKLAVRKPNRVTHHGVYSEPDFAGRESGSVPVQRPAFRDGRALRGHVLLVVIRGSTTCPTGGTQARVERVLDALLVSGRVTILGRVSNGYGHGRRLGPERQHLRAVWADDAASGFGHLVPDAGDVTEGFGDDQPRVFRNFLKQSAFGVHLA